jgi:hypothetical protein
MRMMRISNRAADSYAHVFEKTPDKMSDVGAARAGRGSAIGARWRMTESEANW